MDKETDERMTIGEIMDSRKWCHDKDLFATVCKYECNRWYKDYVITFVEVVEEALDGWTIKIRAFKADETQVFEIRGLRMSRAVLKHSRAIDLWALTMRMVESAHTYLVEELKTEKFCAAMNDLEAIWPIYGFRCSGQPYVTNLDEIERELCARKERHDQD